MALPFMREAELVEWLKTLPRSSYIYRHCAHAVNETDSPLAYHVAIAHGCLASCAPPDFSFRFAGSRVHPSLWIMLVGMSSRDRKTSALNIGRDIIRAVCPDRYGEHPNSVPAFLEGLAAQPQRTYVYGEMGSFLKMTMEGRPLSELRTKFMDAYDGSPLNATVVAARGRNVTQGASRSVEWPRASLWGGVAPVLLERYTSDVDWTGGFTARMSLVWAERERDAPLGATGRARITQEALIDQLRGLSNITPAGCLGFTPEAEALWCDWYLDVTNRYADDTLNEGAIGVANRTPPTVLKLAALHEFDWGLGVRSEQPWRITAPALQAAIGWGEQLLLSGIHATNQVATTGWGRIRRRVFDAVAPAELAPGEPGEWRTLGSIMRRVRPPEPPKVIVDCLHALELEGAIRKRTSAREGGDVWRQTPLPKFATGETGESSGGPG